MKIKKRNIILISGTVLGVFLLVYPFFSVSAQKIEGADKTLQQKASLDVVEKNAVAKSLYDKLQQGEKTNGYEWSLTKAFSSQGSSPSKKDGKETITMVLKKEPLKIELSITEYYSATDAKFPLSLMIEQGVIKDCKGDLCGDEGQKIYSNQGFSSLEFRKDNYFVAITCDSESLFGNSEKVSGNG